MENAVRAAKAAPKKAARTSSRKMIKTTDANTKACTNNPPTDFFVGGLFLKYYLISISIQFFLGAVLAENIV